MKHRIPSLILIICLGVSFAALGQAPERPQKPKPAPGGDGTPPPKPQPATPPAAPAPTPPPAPTPDPTPPKSSSNKSKSDKKDKKSKPKNDRDEPDRNGPSVIIRPPSIVIPPTSVTPPIRVTPGGPARPRPGPSPLAARSCGMDRPHAAHQFRGPGGALLRCPGAVGRPGPLRRP